MAVLTVGKEKNIFSQNYQTFEERAEDLLKQEELEKEALRHDKNSPFSRWTQYNNGHTKELMWLTLKYPKAHAILLFLVDQMDNLNAVMCSYKVLEEVLDVSGETIRKNIKILKDNGYIAILKSGTSNVYAINDNIYWKSWGNQKKFSKFPASVVLSLSEQDEEYQARQLQLEVVKHKEVSIANEND